MKNKILLSIFLLLILPFNVFAKENEISINCNKEILRKNDETICKIIAENLKFTTTSISGEIKLSDNLELIDANYDDKKWKIFDDKFDIQNINLISEIKNVESDYTISTFKIKAINKTESLGKIQFINVILGDENYESHNISVDEKIIELTYETKNEETTNNPQKKDINIIISTIFMICIILILCYFILKYI